MPTEADAALLAEVAAELHGNGLNNEPTTAQRVVSKALEVIGEAEHASVTVIRGRGRFESLGVTSEVARKADEAQYELREGPCVDTAETGEWFRSGDVAHDPRWPMWGPQAARLGVGSLLSVRLLADGQPIGALNLYAGVGGAFSDRDTVDLASIYATHAALALAAAHQLSGLETAMSSRHVIGMAQGMLMQRYALSPDGAFALLRRLSSHQNVKLRDLAEHVVQGRLDLADLGDQG